MLVVTRKPGEAVLIGTAIVAKVISVNGNQVRIGIEAEGLKVLRAELVTGEADLLPTPEPPTEEQGATQP